VGLVRAVLSNTTVPIGYSRYIDKDRRITSTDVGFLRARVSNTTLLNVITIPAAGSGSEGEGGAMMMNVVSNPKANADAKSSMAIGGTVASIGSRWTGLDYAVLPSSPTDTGLAVKSIYGPVQLDSEGANPEQQELGLVDDFFSELGKKRAKKTA